MEGESPKPLVVCGPARVNFDDIESTCEACHAPVFFRPHSPDGRHFCMICAYLLTDGFRACKLTATAETIREVTEYLRQRKKPN